MTKTTPMMIQYNQLKQEHKDAILFFRLGDFYEMFESDAKEASSILDLTLTKRHGIPMCGIPYHAAQTYIARLLKAGRKIAICEQTEMPKGGKGIAKREVVEVVTPGTVVDEELLEQKSNNYLVAIGYSGEVFSLAYIDLSTSEFFATSFPSAEKEEKLRRELLRLGPKEVIIQESLLDEDHVIKQLLYEKEGIVVNKYPDWCFDLETNRRRLEKQMGVQNLKGFGLSETSVEILPAGIILDYVGDTAKSLLPHITAIRIYQDTDYLLLDESTQRNLELIRNLQDGSKKYTLLEVLDFTRTSMGARKLKKWILNPLIKKSDIQDRQKAVHFLYKNQMLLSHLREALGSILDIERLSAKVAMERAHAKDLLAVKSSLQGVCEIYEYLKPYKELETYTSLIEENLPLINRLRDLLEETIAEEPSVVLHEGNLIKDGYNKKLDRLRRVKNDARGVLEEYLNNIKKETGINNLKLRYNKIIGYFLEVTKSNLSLVPEYFIRRQSLVGAERFSTNELNGHETEINSASEKIVELERELFLEIRAKVKENLILFLDLAEHISTIDVLESFAYAATVHGFVKPVLREGESLKIVDGRHPIVEANLPGGAFIPNSLTLNVKDGNFVLLTGPNMAGKSTFLRQVAIVVLMAQTGSFVPASSADIGLVDRIFCRVGASDNLARGESTFLVEMNETANILRSATGRSLLILDEVGRGTSTNDGLSIAWAVCDYILNKIRAKTLFATHYHELTSLKHKQLVNNSMEVVDEGGQIIFLKRIKKGPADSSYGIHVADLAGLPSEVIRNAKRILKDLDKNAKQIDGDLDISEESPQVSLFSPRDMVQEEILNFRINQTTPLEALNIIARWQKELEKDSE